MFSAWLRLPLDKKTSSKKSLSWVRAEKRQHDTAKEILLPEEIQQLCGDAFRWRWERFTVPSSSVCIPGCVGATQTSSHIAMWIYSTKTLRFQQQKTKDHSSRSWVIVPLNDTLIRLIGEPSDDNFDERVFKLPHYNICNLYLRKWVKEAGIKKKIDMALRPAQFRCECPYQRSEHKTVSSLLGHTSIKMTERYLHVVDSLKQDAIDSLGEINYAPM